jgi:6,7-dimethyl-8-ribityllumazine synthase
MSLDKPHILIVEARYYESIADALLNGATRALEAAGVQWTKVTVPGAFEIPAAIEYAIRGGRKYDGYLALGCVIRGETTHYDYVCGESARGLMDMSLRYGLAVGFGILTVENEAQAWARADTAKKDKGGEAARACLSMLSIKRQFGLKQ